MKKNVVLSFLLVLSVATYAQVDNLKIGYQEFPTNITGGAADEAGNLYYSGTFKGELEIDKKGLQTGNGLEDIFLAKTNKAGGLIFTKSFGSKSPDYAVKQGLSYAKNQLFMAVSVNDEVTFQGFTVEPYSTTINNNATSCIISFDTSGTVKRVNKTTLNLTKLYTANGIVHAMGNLPSGPLLYNNTRLYDSLPPGSMVHLMLDTAGHLLNYKTASPQAFGQWESVEPPLYIASYSDGNLSMLLRVSGSSSFLFGGKKIPLPSARNNYYILLKTDTAYASVSYKVLNPSGVNFFNDNGLGLTMCLSKQDSVYLVLASDNAPAGIQYDGLNVPLYKKNSLVVFGPSLKASRVVELGSPSFETVYNYSNRRLIFRTILVVNNDMLLMGTYGGVNESPFNQILQNDSAITLLPNLQAAVDVNGPSKSFVAKTSLGFSKGVLTWIGDHTAYEDKNLYPGIFYTANDSLLVFSLAAGNVWNPRTHNINTHSISGAMMPNADQPDEVKSVAYLPDASRIIIGYAAGKTALDTSAAGIRSNQQRKDAFIARLTAGGEVKWYKRLHSTLLAAQPMKLTIRDGKAYFLINYFISVNQNNFVQVDKNVYDTKNATSLLGSIDTSGTIKVLNLQNSDIKYSNLVDFNFCKNGDMALLTGLDNTVSYASFPSNYGSYLLRLDPVANKIIAARKFLLDDPFSFQPSNIEVDENDVLYVSVPLNSSGGVQNQYKTLSLHDGNKVVDALTIENNVTGKNDGGLGILKMSWNKFTWYKRTGGLNLFGIDRSYPQVFSINNKIVLIGHSYLPYGSMSATSSFYWDNKLVLAAMDPSKSYLFRMDTSGKIEMQKEISNFYIRYAKKKANGSLLLSGYISKATTIDTISVGYDGGNDAVGVMVDSGFTAKKSFRLASPYYEYMEDMDILNDSLATFAYTAQTSVTLKAARTSALINDYAADAFLSSRVIAAPSGTLKLLSFDGELKDSTVYLNWTVSSNEKAKQFVVQCSKNGSPFKDIQLKEPVSGLPVAAYQTTGNLKSYGTYRYRLQLTSREGAISYSRVIEVQYASKGMAFYYNHDSQQLHILNSNSQVYEWKIFDVGGRVMLYGSKTIGSRSIDLSHLSKGQYVVYTVDENAVRQVYKLIK